MQYWKNTSVVFMSKQSDDPIDCLIVCSCHGCQKVSADSQNSRKVTTKMNLIDHYFRPLSASDDDAAVITFSSTTDIYIRVNK